MRWKAALPLLITAVRPAALPGLILLWLGERLLAATALYAAILLSDLVDGWMARRWDAVTVLGAYGDAVADIVVVLGMLVMFSVRGVLPGWLPVLPTVVAAVFLSGSGRCGPRYDPVGKYYGTALYIVVGILLWSQDAMVSAGATAAVAALSASVFVGRWWPPARRNCADRGRGS